METIELFSARVCPFAHRSRLALMEKGLPFEIVEIDLRSKPDWYLAINPAGAVPTLRQGDFILQESLIINEYIDELSDQPPLLPTDPQQRAKARLGIEVFSSRCVPLFYRLLRAQETVDQTNVADKMHQVLTQLDAELKQRQDNGPYWFGPQVSLTDIACYPWFERWPVLQHYRNIMIPSGLKALHAWIVAMQTRDAVQQGAQPVDYYIDEYADYANGKK